MENLKDCTFMIPVRIEHQDRYNNAKSVLGFLNHHFQTNVIIYEVSESGKSKIDFLPDLKNLKIDHMVKPLSVTEAFHRTRYLNIMLDKVKTPVVVNYDIDVFLPPQSYLTCRDRIIKGEIDVYYPYSFGASQYQVLPSVDRTQFNLDFSPQSILSDLGNHSPGGIRRYYSEYGHCIFFNTEVYREFGGENEEFISYGPEDKERGIRFKAFTDKVEWLDDVVFHFEHHRGNDSSLANPYTQPNNMLLGKIQSLIKDGGLVEYYWDRPYYKGYKKIGRNRKKWSPSMEIYKEREQPVQSTPGGMSASNPLRL
jgi:predicted glycosyltransferase involved in capsule biosynthesis